MGKPFSFTIEFTGELDQIHGTFYSEADFQNMVIRHFQDSFNSYNPVATVTATTDARGVFGGWMSMQDGWIDVEGFERPPLLPDWIDIQFKTIVQPYGWTEWLKPGAVWVPERNHPVDRVIQYRFRKPADGQAYNVTDGKPTKPFEVGKQYLTIAGKVVTCTHVHDKNRGYETAQFDDRADDLKGHRYNRDQDRGRCTGSPNSSPRNVIPELVDEQ